MRTIVKQAIEISRERYANLGYTVWGGLAPEDCVEAIRCHIDEWQEMTQTEQKSIIDSMSLRLAAGYELTNKVLGNGYRKIKKDRHKPRHKSTILVRDGMRCVYCNGIGPLHIDHIVPRAKGGTDRAGNLVAACSKCNQHKSSTTLDSEPEWLAFASESNKRIKLPDDTIIELHA
jgi:hypothetical protein